MIDSWILRLTLVLGGREKKKTDEGVLYYSADFCFSHWTLCYSFIVDFFYDVLIL